MRWRKLESSDNVQDRRGTGRAVAAGAGGLGILGLLAALIFGGLSGGGGFDNVGDLLGQVQTEQAAAPAQQPEEFEGLDESEDFVRPKHCAGLGRRDIPLADMSAVCICGHSSGDIIIDDQRDTGAVQRVL